MSLPPVSKLFAVISLFTGSRRRGAGASRFTKKKKKKKMQSRRRKFLFTLKSNRLHLQKPSKISQIGLAEYRAWHNVSIM